MSSIGSVTTKLGKQILVTLASTGPTKSWSRSATLIDSTYKELAVEKIQKAIDNDVLFKADDLDKTFEVMVKYVIHWKPHAARR
jgi:hypothetical protein